MQSRIGILPVGRQGNDSPQKPHRTQRTQRLKPPINRLRQTSGYGARARMTPIQSRTTVPVVGAKGLDEPPSTLRPRTCSRGRRPRRGHQRLGIRAPFQVSRVDPKDFELTPKISTQLGQQIPGFDEPIATGDPDFVTSGLKRASVIRVTRLAVVHRSILLGTIGQLGSDRLRRIQTRLGQWLTAS